jgi:excisionase family DNA binding protein
LWSPVFERLKYLRRCYPYGDEVAKWNEAEIHLTFHTHRLAAEICKHEQTVKSLGLSEEELRRIRAEVRKDAEAQTPVAELPAAELWLRVQSFLNKQPRPPGSMDPPTTGVAITPASPASGEQKQKLEERVRAKLQNQSPSVMTVAEAAYALGKSESTIYRWLDEGKLRWSKTEGRIPTAEVRRLMEPDED